MFRRLSEKQSLIKTYDQPVYEVKAEENNVRVILLIFGW